MFVGRINRQSVTGVHHKGNNTHGPRQLDNDDNDAYVNSMEECINDALHGYCTTLGGDDDILTVVEVDCADFNLSQRGKQGCFKVTFNFPLDQDGDLDTFPNTCATSECSDHIDNDCDGTADQGGAHGQSRDIDCSDYDDPDESSFPGCV